MSGIPSVSIASANSLASVSPQQQSLQPFGNLDLTSAQRSQLRSIFTAAKQNGTSQADVQKQVDAVLTPAQQQALQADQAAFKAGGRGHHHHSQTDATAPQSTDGSSDALGASTSATASSASAPSTAAATTNSTDATILAILTNLQNQATAAQSTLNKTLQSKLVAVTSSSANGAATPSATTETSGTTSSGAE